MATSPEGSKLIWHLSRNAFSDGAAKALEKTPELLSEPAHVWIPSTYLYYTIGQRRFTGFNDEITHPLFPKIPEAGGQPIVEYGALYTPVDEAIQSFIKQAGFPTLQQHLDRVRRITELSAKRRVVVLPERVQRDFAIRGIQPL